MNIYVNVRVYIKVEKYWNKSILWFIDGIYIYSYYVGGWEVYEFR